MRGVGVKGSRYSPFWTGQVSLRHIAIAPTEARLGKRIDHGVLVFSPFVSLPPVVLDDPRDAAELVVV